MSHSLGCVFRGNWADRLPDDLDDGTLERRLYGHPAAKASAFVEPTYMTLTKLQNLFEEVN